MSSFHGGPAEGWTASTRRAPKYLRVVVVKRNGKFDRATLDCLDQLDDVARENESIFVYRREGAASFMCIRPGGCFESGTYHYLPDVKGDRLRANDVWVAWADADPYP